MASARCHYVWLLLFVLLVSFYGAAADAIPAHAQLTKSLLANYESTVRPVRNYSQPTIVAMDVNIYQVEQMDVQNNKLLTNAWINLYWKDEFLTWDLKQYPGVHELHILHHQVWTPDITLYNSVHSGDISPIEEILNKVSYIKVSNQGWIWWSLPLRLDSSCNMDIKYYPFDIQTCFLQFASWMFSSKHIILTTARATARVKKERIVNGGLHVKEAKCSARLRKLHNITNPHSDVSCMLKIRREPLYYWYFAFAPCIIIWILGSSVFLVPAGEMVTMSVTLLLALIVSLQLIMQNLPASDQISIGVHFLMCMQAILGVITLITMFLSQRANKAQSTDRENLSANASRLKNGYSRLPRANDELELSLIDGQASYDQDERSTGSTIGNIEGTNNHENYLKQGQLCKMCIASLFFFVIFPLVVFLGIMYMHSDGNPVLDPDFDHSFAFFNDSIVPRVPIET